MYFPQFVDLCGVGDVSEAQGVVFERIWIGISNDREVHVGDWNDLVVRTDWI